uniref:Wsv295-like protein n=1 Tax=Metopaulias depressus WSSV-like virus TaxID=1675544 RepID=A0A0K0VLU5_9VIRU|nr:wsv295-like protein [Metopaulias depressus WSSV-like virus]
MTSSTISLRTSDFSPHPFPPKEEEITIASPSPTWVSVEENEEELETARFSDSNEEEEEEEEEEEDFKSVTELGRRLTSSERTLNNNLSDDSEDGDDLFSDDEENVSRRSECCDHDDKKEPTTNCCNLKGICNTLGGIGNTLAKGFCRVVNTIVSCIKEKLSSRQMFILAGATIAAIFKTKNVAVDEDGDDEGGDVDLNSSTSANNISEDIINAVVDVAIDSITSTDKN